MMKAMKKALSVILVVVIMLTAAPLSGFVGLELPKWLNFTITSKASTLTNGSSITLGSYPQSQVTNADLISQLNAIEASWTSFKYLDSNGEEQDYMFYKDVTLNNNKYRAVTLTKNRGYSSTNGYSIENIYWFKYEPLTWKVLNSTSGLVVCEKVVDSQPYHHTSAKTDGYYGNNYEKSDIRRWLTHDFYNTAFSNVDKMCIKLTSVDNTATSSTYSAKTTNDYVFALSRSEASSYKNVCGFSPIATSYAKIQGAWCSSSSSSWLWGLRTAGSYSYGITYVKYGGLDRNTMDDAIQAISGVRPALCLNTLIDYSANDNIYDIQIGRNRLSFGEEINTTVGENLGALLQYTADKELLSSLEITSSNPDVVEVGTISNGSNRITCGENEYSAEIKLKPKKIGSSVITVTAPNGISESVTVNVGNTIYGTYESSVITVELDGGEDNYWASALKIDGIEYSVNKNYSKQINLVNNEDKYKNKEVVIVISDGEVVWIDTVDNIKVGLNATISLSQNNLYYTDKKYSTDKIYATIKVSSTCSNFPGNASVLNDIPSLQTSISSVELRTSNNDVLTFDGEEVKTINTSSKLAFGKTQTLGTVVINVDDSYKISKKQANEIVGISCTVSGDRNGTPVSRTVATNVVIENKNYSRPVSSQSTDNTTTVQDAQKAARALESVMNTSAVTVGSETLYKLFSANELSAIGATVLMETALVCVPESKLDYSSSVFENIMGFSSKWFGAVFGEEISVTYVSNTAKYGEIEVKITCNLKNYTSNDSKIAFFGDLEYEIIGGKDKKNLPDDILNKGSAGLVAGADMTAFSNSVYNVANDIIKGSYEYGDSVEDAADILFGQTVDEILRQSKYGSYIAAIKRIIVNGKQFIIKCPVDVYVYNENDELVASVEDNIITLTDDNVKVDVDGDTKILYIHNDNYYIKYRSLAEYDMEVVVNEYGYSDCLLRTVTIEEIPLQIGTEFTQDCGESDYDVVEYSLIADNKEIYSPTDDSSAIHEHIVTDEWELIQEPTCEVYGFNAALCSVCNEWCKDIIAPTGHNYINGFCTVCEENIEDNFAIGAMSSQIRFDRNDDGSYAETFAVRTRAMISDKDFTELVGATNEEAIKNIDKIGFVYTLDGENFSATSAQAVAQGEKISGYVDAPVSYVQDADGYYMFTCLVTDIPDNDKGYTLTAYAYICVNGKWCFSETPMNADFNSLYETYYPKACEKYGW